MTQFIPLQQVPSQTFEVTLAGQRCRINIYQRVPGLFCDLYVNDVLIIGGVQCQDRNPIVRDAYLGFVGDLRFVDIQGADDPEYSQLGTRFVLAFMETADQVT